MGRVYFVVKTMLEAAPRKAEKKNVSNYLFFIFWWFQMAFIAIFYMFIDLFAFQHIADKPVEYRTSNAHQYLRL